MAMQEYIIMRTDLHEDPDVIRIAQMMNPPQRTEVVVGYLHRVWSWATRATADGVVSGLRLESIESLLDVPGFLVLMRNVGWLDYLEGVEGCSITFPKWDRFMDKGTKKRLQDARRKQLERKDEPRTNVQTNADKCPQRSGRAVDVDVDVVVAVPKKKKRNSFTPPTVELVAQYVCLREDGHHCNPGEFVDYFAAQGWKLSNGNAMKDWQAAVRQWISRSKKQGKSADHQQPYLDRLAAIRQRNAEATRADEEAAKRQRASEYRQGSDNALAANLGRQLNDLERGV